MRRDATRFLVLWRQVLFLICPLVQQKLRWIFAPLARLRAKLLSIPLPASSTGARRFRQDRSRAPIKRPGGWRTQLWCRRSPPPGGLLSQLSIPLPSVRSGSLRDDPARLGSKPSLRGTSGAARTSAAIAVHSGVGRKGVSGTPLAHLLPTPRENRQNFLCA
jgi:hypothetical protein